MGVSGDVFPRALNDGDALTICHKVFGHVEGDLDGEGAGVLRGVDHGQDARADGDQRQGDLAQRTVSVAWGGGGGKREVKGQRPVCASGRGCDNYPASRNLIPNPGKSIECISRFVSQDQLGWTVCWITHPDLCGAAFQPLPSPTHGLIAPDGVIDWLFWLPFSSARTPISKAGYAE